MSSYSSGNGLRTLRPEDYSGIISVWERSGLSHRPIGRDSQGEIERQMALDPDMWLGYFLDGQLVGLVVGSYDSRKGWLNRLAVVPEHRGKGIAAALAKEMEKRLGARGIRIIAVLIEDGHESSAALFLGQGYVVHGDIKYLTKRQDPDV